jgi:tRNA nucleotidyltransferase (CCA-adding enzyme)
MNIQTIDTGLAHGTITMMIPINNEFIPVEITTFRKDVETDGRNATIEYARTIEEDLSRRDFTFNAMAINLKTKELLDPFNGMTDLKEKNIKFVGSGVDRIKEDHLRMIRMIRFLFQLKFNINETYFNEVKEVFNINVLSKERIKMEMDKIIDNLNPKNLKYMNLLFDSNILSSDSNFDLFNSKNINKFSISIIEEYIKNNNKENKILLKYYEILENIDENHLIKVLKFSNSEVSKLIQIKKIKEEFKQSKNLNISLKKLLNSKIDKELLNDVCSFEYKLNYVYNFNSEVNHVKELNNIIKHKEPYELKDLDISSQEVENVLVLKLSGKDFRKEYIGKCLKFLIQKVIENKDLNNKNKLKDLVNTFLIEENLINKPEIKEEYELK